MNQQQMEVLNVVHQLLKGVLLAVAASNPQGKEAIATTLQAFAQHPGIDPMTRELAADLATGMAVVASVGKARQ